MHRSCQPSLGAVALAFAAVVTPSWLRAEDAGALALWEIGAVGVAVWQQAYPGAAEHVSRALALPFLIYRGKFLRADRDGVGIRAVKTPAIEVDIGVAGAFGSNADEVRIRRGMPDLGTLVEFGPRLKWNIGRGPGNGRLRLELPLRGVFDLNEQLAFRGLAFEPELIFERVALGGWSYRSGVGAVLGNQRLADTLYGVAAPYATAARPAYGADTGLINWRLSASASHDMSPDLRLFGFARLDSVAGAANQSSPLVQRTSGTSIGLGLTYTWQRSQSRAAD